MSLQPYTWTILEPSVIRDAVSGRLGYQDAFGATYVSGATQALALRQQPLDGSADQGDAYLYAGTTNGGVYVRAYDYQTDTWAPEWSWVSSPADGYDGAQGIGALALSPDGQFIAVGRGNSSSFAAYTPNGPALQIGQLAADGGVQWLPVVTQGKSGTTEGLNIRALCWQDDGLYVSASGVQGSFVGRFGVDQSGVIDIDDIQQFSRSDDPITLGSSDPAAPVLWGVGDGSLTVVVSGQPQSIGGEDWEALRADRFAGGQVMGRLTVAPDPNQADGYVALIGWYDGKGGFISSVDRLTITSDNRISALDSLDFAGQAGGGQASSKENYGNFALLFDMADPSLSSVYVGGNQYMDSHPVGTIPLNCYGGFVRGSFDTGEITAVLGPLKDTEGNLCSDSLLIGAPHADSRSGLYYETPTGQRLIETDDGGIWQLAPASTNPSVLSWTSLNAPGLHSLETVASAWDARSNSFVSSFQDNSSSIGQWGDAYMDNVWAGDGNLALMDGASTNDGDNLSWAYVDHQQYMYRGQAYAFGLKANGTIASTELLTMVTNRQGTAVQPIRLAELDALIQADVGPSDIPFKYPATTNPYQQGDLVFAGSSGLYESFIPHWSDQVTVDGYGTLGLLPVAPFSDANTTFTDIDLGSSDAVAGAQGEKSPTYWDSLAAVSWDKDQNQSTIWYRDPVTIEPTQAPATLAAVDRAFLDKIALQPLSLPEEAMDRVITGIAHAVDAQGNLNALYWIEAGCGLVYDTGPSKSSLLPSENDPGASLVMWHDGEMTRFPYADTSGLSQLVRAGDFFGPTALALMPAIDDTQPALLVVGGEHGLYSAELDANGVPGEFQPMNVAGLDAGVQMGSAISGLSYNAEDDLLVASLLGGGSMLYSRSGEIGPTPAERASLQVSDTVIPQHLSDTLDKRGNPVQGQFAIELPSTAFDAAGHARVEFTILDAEHWKDYLDGVSFLLSVSEGGADFNLLKRSGDTITETLDFYDFADRRLGFVQTLSSNQALPPIDLPYQVTLLDDQGRAVETVSAEITLAPNASTPSFLAYEDTAQSGKYVYQAQLGYLNNDPNDNDPNDPYLPPSFKVGLPADLPQGAEVFAFEVDGPDGAITLDGATYAPSDPDYLSVAVPASKIAAQTPLIAGPAHAGQGVDVSILSKVFSDGGIGDYLATEGLAYGTAIESAMPEAFAQASLFGAAYLGVAIQYPDGTLKATTVDTTALNGNEINLDPNTFDSGIVVDVGYGGIFAAQTNGGSVSVAKLGALPSAVGFVRVDDLFGSIGEFAPGEAGYAEAALQRSLDEGLDITLDQDFGTRADYDLDGLIQGVYYASYITPGYATVAEALAGTSDRSALFSFDAANPDGNGGHLCAAIPFAVDVIAFEDLPQIGDADYNDIVLAYDFFV